MSPFQRDMAFCENYFGKTNQFRFLFLYSSSAENRTKKKVLSSLRFLGNKNPNVSMGSQQGVFSQKRECFAGGRTCDLANFTLSKMILEARTEPGGGFLFWPKTPSPLAEDPLAAETMLTTVWPKSCSGYRPSWPSSLAVPAVRRPWPPRPSVAPWQSGVSGAAPGLPAKQAVRL